MSILKSLFSLLILILVLSCGEEEEIILPPDPCDGTSYNYTDDIGPIIDGACARSGCHDGSNTLSPFTTYGDVFGRRWEFRSAIRSNFSGLPPQARGRLTEVEQDMILCWVENGAPE